MTGATPPTAALLIIGAEVLAGKVEDANGPYLIRSLRERGICVIELRVIDDDVALIADAVRALSTRATYLFTTGGIGPTHDDVTIEGVAAAFGVPVVHDPELVRRVASRYGKGSDGEEGPHMRLAEVPAGSVLLGGREAVVPAIKYDNVYIFPGVPSMVVDCFCLVAEELAVAAIFSKGLWLRASESTIAPTLEAVQCRSPGVSIGSYPRFDDGRSHFLSSSVKITVDGRDETAVDEAVAALRNELDPDWIISVF